jgi:putative nucleotidyltransferase with HDIG domain
MAQRMAALLRVAGNSKTRNWEITKIRCERGAEIARMVGFSEGTAAAIASLDEHWNGSGLPERLSREQIPMLSRIMLLAQTLDVFFTARGAADALWVIQARKGEWFDPKLVDAVESIDACGYLWADVSGDFVYDVVLTMEPEPKWMREEDETFKAICLAFSQIVDSKSPFTFSHSENVAQIARAMGETMQLNKSRLSALKNAALLHDLGKMAVSNEILEKPAGLDEDEWRVMRLHPFYTWKILHSVPRFGEVGEIAAAHHEKLDGSGYFRGFGSGQLSLEARILAVAEIMDALCTKAPWRTGLTSEAALRVLWKDTPHKLDANCVAALEESGLHLA